MLSALVSVGATRFDLTHTTLHGEKARFQRNVSHPDLCARVENLLHEATRIQQNVIVRPVTTPPVVLLQLDDLNAEGITRIAPHAFLSVQTSPGSHQAWIALTTPSEAFVRRLRQGVGADPTASGAVRLAGSQNFKPKYAPDYPCIRVTEVALGVFADPATLKAAGLLAPLTPEAQPSFASSSGVTPLAKRVFPDYQKCLDGAPANHGGTAPDRSRADFTFCLLALDWGFGVEETAERAGEALAKRGRARPSS